MRPLVSILIPCYNAERWIAACIESALAQSYPHKEVVVVDDGSTDNSREIIESFGSQIKYEIGPNHGGNPTRNRLLNLAQGEWLQYLDADDCLLENKISDQVSFLSAHPETDIVFGPVIMEHWNDGKADRDVLPIPEPHDPWILLARWFLPQTGSPLWRKQAICDVGGWKQDQPCCQEHELYLRLLIAGKRFDYCSAPGAVYRQWSETTVCKKDRGLVRSERLKVLATLQDHLKATEALSPDRQEAINLGRFEMARTAWQHDHAEALEIMSTVVGSQRGFAPSGPAAPASYQLFFRLLGFRWAETIADIVRRQK